jgi:replicative DNA helicase
MQVLLRSTFRVDPKDDLALLLSNALELKQSHLDFLVPEHDIIWSFVNAFVSDHNHVPDVTSLILHFSQTEPNPDAMNQLQLLRGITPITRGDFKKRLATKMEERKTVLTEELFKFANLINRKGVEVTEEAREGTKGQKKILKGYRDALRYVTGKALDISRPTTGIRKEGEATTDTKQFVEDYDRRHADPSYGRGQLCGIEQFDVTMGGARKDQLWTHAAFTGELKSTFAFNWVYNQAIYFGYSSCFFSLEMPYDQCQRIIYTMHSLHPKFQEARLDLGVQKEAHIPTPISYPYLRDGQLVEGEERLLKDIVLPDLEAGSACGMYGKMHFRGYDPDSDYFRVSDIRAKGETLYRENPFSLLIVDHVLLVDSKRRHSSTTESANEVVRDLKKLSETFNAGEGVALLALFQMSREGKKRADKADGRYNLYDLSYSNEIERSSDVITASYLNDELRKRCRGLFQFLKARDGGMCEPFYTRIDWPTRMLFTCHDNPSEGTGDVVEEVEGTRFEDVLS